MRSKEAIKAIIQQSISLFKLNLEKKVVLTEAANGDYFVTPIIAALAGADVIAAAKDSRYGKAKDICNYVQEKAELFGVADKITFAENELQGDLIKKADIITNLGFVRPIDQKFIEHIKKDAVIAGMCEAWEIRSDDVDLNACTEKGIPVAAVHEQSPKLDIFKYVAYIIIKIVLELGFELYRTRLLIVSRDKFGTVISDTLSQVGASTSLVEKLDSRNAQLIEARFDAVILADYSPESEKEKIVLDSLLIKKVTYDPLLIHLAGEVNYQNMKDKGVRCFPEKDGYTQRMSETFSYLGIRPIIELHTAGLAAAQMVLTEKPEKKSLNEIISAFENHSFVSILNKAAVDSDS